MDRYSEDELRILKQISEEIFVISNKPQLPFVQKMKATPCDIMSTGYKKIASDFFFCKACDKEHKYPISSPYSCIRFARAFLIGIAMYCAAIMLSTSFSMNGRTTRVMLVIISFCIRSAY